ncbi:serine-threonine protein kinase, putative [Entamoeba invadens IP1]|uniref:Serine-threonine protein kinase, putative n=1 Tax=Entamoeba invadens IP1 TaxID=370355 RepID=A0A0A1TZ34_ENTIV|nr:serine-threonine protein kinase, putative [Entamoeba invadens IP1]ELP86825.1 serine-threonine protein kinase, putative [Entamoeba invadens IP1]|eukprot:XP_004253596.1 serine-threonine protein kinase, putative [Entamoeba invadens IP1]
MTLLIVVCIVAAFACNEGEYFDQTTATCKACENNCKTCSTQTLCLTCVDSGNVNQPYVLDQTYQCVLRPQITNCISYTGVLCTQCDKYYYLNNQVCTQCDADKKCTYCNSQECFQCSYGYTLVKNGKECVDCSQAVNDADCGRCPADRYFDISTLSCMPCKDFCDHCTSATNCYSCSTGYALADSNNTESNCVRIENCADGFTYGDHCERCNPSYFLKDGKCAKCGNDCIACIDDSICTECINSKKLANGKCIDTIEHCLSADNINGCTACESGYYIGQGSVCVKCGVTCSTCVSESYCFRCAANYYFGTKEGECLPKKEDCEATDQYGCMSCKTNIKNDAQCEIDKVVDTTGSINCTTQTYGYYLEATVQADGTVKYAQQCQQCNLNCKTCAYNKDWCTSCNDGYTLAENVGQRELYRMTTKEIGNVYNCLVKPASCKTAEMGYCTECVEGYFLSDVSCVLCDESCGSCTSDLFCQTCSAKKDANGKALYWRPSELSALENEAKGLCMKLSETSVQYGLDKCTHDPTNLGCTSCNDTYYLHNNYCKQCPLDLCSKCKESAVEGTNETKVICLGCSNNTYLVASENRCVACDSIEKCSTCETDGCHECTDDYKPTPDRKKCTKVNVALIVPLSIAGLVIVVVVVVLILFLIWRRRLAVEKERKKSFRPTKVSSELEMLLASSDNVNFPLKAIMDLQVEKDKDGKIKKAAPQKWDFDFGLKGEKPKVDEEITQTIKIVNPTKVTYYFEFTTPVSHQYEITFAPKQATLKPQFGVDVKITFKALCTTNIEDNIAICANTIEDTNKEIAKFSLRIESDISLKLDYNELKANGGPIGEGAFGQVFRGNYRGMDVAIKKMKEPKMTDVQKYEFDHEITMLKLLRHETTVNYIGAVYTMGEYAIVTEFIPFGALSKLHQKENFPLELKEKIMDDVAAAIYYLHSLEVLHRDVKGENVLISAIDENKTVCGKLTDFGTCRLITEQKLKEKPLTEGVGTPSYMPPEALQHKAYGKPMDVFAFAITMYETFVEHPAYVGDRFEKAWNIPQFVSEGKRLEKPNGIPEDYWKLVTDCWKDNQDERPTIKEVLVRINNFELKFTRSPVGAGMKEDKPIQKVEEKKEEKNEEVKVTLDEVKVDNKEVKINAEEVTVQKEEHQNTEVKVHNKMDSKSSSSKSSSFSSSSSE